MTGEALGRATVRPAIDHSRAARMLSSSAVREASHHACVRPPDRCSRRPTTLGEVGEVGRVAIAHGDAVVPLGEPLAAVVGEGQQQAVTTGPVGDDERLVDEAAEELADLGGGSWSSAQTASAASSVQPPTNTDSRSNTVRSSSNSRS